jgi:DNA-binding MarR family transcriptional regulator
LNVSRSRPQPKERPNVRSNADTSRRQVVNRHAERDLEILTAIGEDRGLSQRALSERLGAALGLTNLLLKRLATKGYIKTVSFASKPAARKRLRYLLTAKGVAEKTRLTYEHVTYSLSLYRRTRQRLRERLMRLPENGLTRIVLYGAGEAAELAYLTLREFGLEPTGVVTDADGATFLGQPTRPLAALPRSVFDAVVVATFEHPEPRVAELVRIGVPRAKIITLRGLGSDRTARRGA